MIQTALVSVIVAAAAAWTVWSMGLRGWLRRRAAGKSQAACGPDCACGD
jgi:hypothetical protein